MQHSSVGISELEMGDLRVTEGEKNEMILRFLVSMKGGQGIVCFGGKSGQMWVQIPAFLFICLDMLLNF